MSQSCLLLFDTNLWVENGLCPFGSQFFSTISTGDFPQVWGRGSSYNKQSWARNEQPESRDLHPAQHCTMPGAANHISSGHQCEPLSWTGCMMTGWTVRASWCECNWECVGKHGCVGIHGCAIKRLKTQVNMCKCKRVWACGRKYE